MKSLWRRLKFWQTSVVLGVVGLVAWAQVPGSAPYAFWRNHGAVFVNFTTATQAVNDYDGAYGVWSATLTSWSKRVRIGLENGGISNTLTNYPVLVILNSSRVNYADIKAAGADLRFTDSSDNLLNFEIESWNTSGSSYIWVNVPTITANSISGYIYMYYGNAVATDGQNVAGTWNANFVGNWKMNGTVGSIANGANVPATVGPNATANNPNGTNMAYQTAALNQGVYLDGVDDYISIPHQASLNMSTAWTISSWVKFSAIPTDNAPFIVDTYSGNIQFCLGYCGSTGITAAFYNGWYRSPAYKLTSADLNTWKYVTGVYNGAAGTLSLYIDGTLIGTTTGVPSSISTNGGVKRIGRRWDGTGDFFNGVVDNVRFMNNAQPAGWVLADYMNFNDRFLTYGPVQTQTTGQVSVTLAKTFSAGPQVTAPFTLSGTAVWATDHNYVNGNFVIPISQLSVTQNFMVYRNPYLTVDRGITVSLGAPTNASLGAINIQSITLTGPGNRAPTTSTLNLTNAGTLPTMLVDVLSVASDADGDALKIQSVSAASNGTTSISGNYISYVPSPGFLGADSFTYTIVDPYGGTVNGTVNVNSTGIYQGRVWTGLAGDGKWSTVGNWSGNTKPTSTDVAYFNPAMCSGAACNATVDVDPNCMGIYLVTGYSGTITQSAGISMSIGTSGWIQPAGTFVGANSAITITNGPFNLTGGSFTSTSGNFSSTQNSSSYSAAFTIGAGATFAANNGTIVFDYISNTINTGSATLKNVMFKGGYVTTADLAGSTMTVSGDLTLQGGHGCNCSNINNGTILVSGNLSSTVTAGSDGSANIKLVGNASGQTITGTSSTYFPLVTIDTGANNVTLSGTLRFNHGLVVTTVGTLDATGTTVHVHTGAYTISSYSSYIPPTNLNFGYQGYDLAGFTITPSSLTYNNVSFYGNYGQTFNLGGNTLNVGGNLILSATHGAQNSPINSGTIVVLGNVTASNYGNPGSAVIKLANSIAQTITGTASTVFPSIEIASTGGGVTTSGPISSAGNLKITSGTLTVASNISFGSVTFLAGSTGTLVQSTTNTITVGATGWSQAAGTFTGGSGAVTINGPFALSGGTFTSTSGTMTVNGVGTSTIWAVTGSPTFSGNGGTVAFVSNGRPSTITPGSVSYANVSLTSGNMAFDLGSNTMTIAGNLTLGDSIGTGGGSGTVSNGTLDVAGNVTAVNAGYAGTGVVRLTGNGSGQTITGTSSNYFPNVTIVAGANNVSLSGTVQTANSFVITSVGTFTGTGAALKVGYNYTVTSFSTFNAPDTLTFNATGTTGTVTIGSEVYQAVVINTSNGSIDLNGSTMIVGGNLSLGDTIGTGGGRGQINNGTLSARANVTGTNYGHTGSASLTFNGSSAQTMTSCASCNLPTGTVTVNNASGLTLGSNVTWNGASQTLAVTTGPVGMAGFNLTLHALTLNSNTLTKSGGVLTVNSVVQGTGSLFGGTVNP